MKLLDDIRDRWTTWRTGKSRTEREWEDWYDKNVNWRANNITDMFKNFKHVIEVDATKFLWDEGTVWAPHPAAQQYFYPQRSLGENCVWRLERVSWSDWQKRWIINGIGSEDRVFVATNSDEDAVMIALRWR